MPTPRPFMEYLKDVPIADVHLSRSNPRRSIDEAKLEELRDSIKQAGVQQPLIVRPIPASDSDGGMGFEIVAGERRYRAACDVGLVFVPCIVRDLNDEQMRETQIVENLQRADIHPAEEADAYAAMMEAPELAGEGPALTVEDIAKKVGKPTSYVAARIRLRSLDIDSKLLFIKGHLTVGHALLLARLEIADQERALRFMLNSDPKFDKRPITEIVRKLLNMDKEPELERGPDITDEEWEEELEAERQMNEDAGWQPREVNPQTVSKMLHGRRLIDATEAQLKKWIESNVLLKLATAPWRLDDDQLVPAAGACVDCPKRSGSNAALFSELTSETDVCLDTTCYSAKQDATVKAHKEAAKSHAKADGCAPGGGLLLKISSKHSAAKLEEIAVEGGQVVTCKTVKEGQWVPAGDKSCGNVVKALVVDGADKGKMLEVCADQKCKVHTHQIHQPYQNSFRSDPVKEAAEKEKKQAYVKSESEIRMAIYRQIRAKAKPSLEFIRKLILSSVRQRGAMAICQLFEIPVRTKGEEWEISRDAQTQFAKWLPKATKEQLELLVFDSIHVAYIEVHDYQIKENKQNRQELWALAAQHKVDADKIALAYTKASTNGLVPVKTAKKTPAKKAASKKKVK